MKKSKMDHDKLLRQAIHQAVRMWSAPEYERFLHRKKPGKLNEDEDKFNWNWFKWFVRDWSVARNIKKERREDVRVCLDTNFRDLLASEDIKGVVVDKMAKKIRVNGWCSKKSENGNGPLSLVSKIGFFFKPNILIPYDSFGRDGLKKLGVPRNETKSYAGYLKAFDRKFKLHKKEIKNALKEPWVKALARKYRCPVKCLKLPSIRRKVFDNYLVALGRGNSDKT